MKTLDKWKGLFGTEYHKRNESDDAFIGRSYMWTAIFKLMMKDMKPTEAWTEQGSPHVLEVGAGAGHNIPQVLGQLWLATATITALEPNKAGADAIRSRFENVRVIEDDWMSTAPLPVPQNIVYTSGVLIHIPTKDLRAFIKKMYDQCSQYIVICEYYSARRRQVKYHGEKQMLWTDDYGKYFAELGMDLLDCTFWYRPLYGVDNLTVWVFKK